MQPNEAMKAMAKRIASQFAEASENTDYEVHIALTAIMETQRLDAELAEQAHVASGLDWTPKAIAERIRTGEHYALAGERHG